MGGIGRGLVVVGGLLLLCLSVPAEEETLSERLAERDRLREEFQAARAEGDTRRTLAAIKRILAVEREISQEARSEVADTLGYMALLHENLGDFPAARRCLVECLEIRIGIHGPDDWRVALARSDLEELDLRAGLTPEQSAREREALDLHNSIGALLHAGKYREALEPATRVVEIWTDVLGGTGRTFADAVINLALIHKALGRLARAQDLYRQGLECRKKALGERHPWTAETMRGLAGVCAARDEFREAEALSLRSLEILEETVGTGAETYGNGLNALAVLYQDMGDQEKALPLLLRALKIRGEAAGRQTTDYATCLNNLGALYREMNRSRKAEPLYRQALEIYRTVLGEDHPRTAVIVHNLGNVLEDLGELDEAEEQYRRALDIVRRTLGEEHPQYAGTLGQLANLVATRGDHEAAKRLFEQVLEIQRRTLGAEHSAIATTLNNLALTSSDAGDLERAASLLEQALGILRKVHGEAHPYYAASLANLASVRWRAGDLAAAEALYREALRIREGLLGPDHLDISANLHDLALCCLATGRSSEAEALLRRGISIVGRYMDLTSSLQSEREQLRTTRRFRRRLDALLSATDAAGSEVAGAYAPVVAWKGSVYARKASIRALRDPELASIGEEFERVSRRLAKLASAVPESEDRRGAWREKIRELTTKREKLEAGLYRRSAEYRKGRDAAQLTPEQLAEALPPGVALIDLLEYAHMEPGEPGEKAALQTEERMVAFIVRRDAAIRRVELGRSAPIREAVEAWRKEMGDSGPLGRLVWDPVRESVKGAETILVSPDGALCRFPFAALPGRVDGTWLGEDLRIAVLPVPRLLPLLLAEPAPAAGGEKESLLLVGDVDYGGTPGPADHLASRSAAGTGAGPRPRFGELPATRAEILAIADSFERRFPQGTDKMLREGGATEAAFRAEAPKYRWLHLATHGFFAPPGLEAARLPRLHPGLLSGLALSGANSPPEPEGDDGILTALEVESLDLTAVRTAVLSSCETGLGEVAAGEGVLGLQRAFQVAGAETTLTSLWAVPDVATQLLMQRFYENLWDGNLGKLEALVEAQRWMMREGSKRGLGTERAVGRGKPLPPYYWAGFVLSGDWR